MTFRTGTLKDRLQVASAMDVLGSRFKIRDASITKGRATIEVVEGDEETVYRIDARNAEQMCGMLLKKVFEDKAKAAGRNPIPEEPRFVASGSPALINDDIEKIIRETMSMKGVLRTFVKEK